MEEEDTIELIDYLRVVWKWKWLIVLLMLVCMVTAGAVSIVMPEIYSITSMIEPGTIGSNKDGALIYFDSPDNIRSRIEEGAYNRKIINALKLYPNKKGISEFEASTPRGSRIVKITCEYESSEIDLGLKAMNRLLEELSGQYKEIVDLKRNDIEKQIMLNKTEIEKINNKIRLLRRNIKINEEEEKFLVAELEKVRANTEVILKKRDALLDKKTSDYAISALLYSNTIQQNMIYINELNNQVITVRKNKGDLKKEIDDLENDIEKINTEIERFNLQKGFVQNIKQIQEPQVSIFPVKPKKRLNVAMAGIAGLFVSICLAFFFEYIQKVKSYPSSPTSTTQKAPSIKNKE